MARDVPRPSRRSRLRPRAVPAVGVLLATAQDSTYTESPTFRQVVTVDEIRPVEATFHGAATFTHTFPPNSVTFRRVRPTQP